MGGKVYGYARVSTREQNLDRQLVALEEFGVERGNIFADKASGRDFERPEWIRMRAALKAGDVVVLALRNTPDNLSKRILDFSFGVSSALDASVDCVADKVFVISRGAALTDAERMSLRGQGVL